MQLNDGTCLCKRVYQKMYVTSRRVCTKDSLSHTFTHERTTIGRRSELGHRWQPYINSCPHCHVNDSLSPRQVRWMWDLFTLVKTTVCGWDIPCLLKVAVDSWSIQPAVTTRHWMLQWFLYGVEKNQAAFVKLNNSKR